jgi:hypothetical protein
MEMTATSTGSIEPVCPECGHNGIAFECTAVRWNIDVQEFLISGDIGEGSCDKCEACFDDPEWLDVGGMAP